MRRRALMTKCKQALPSGYTQLEYLEGLGTSSITTYINTGVLGSQTTGIDVDCQVVALKSGQCFVFGGEYAWKNRSFDYATHISGLVWHTQTNTTNLISDFERHNIKLINRKFSIDDSAELTLAGWGTATAALRPVALFGIIRNNTIVRTDAVRIFSCKMYDGDTLVRDFIPCLDASDRPCLYDLTTKQPYYNEGTGEFLYG